MPARTGQTNDLFRAAAAKDPSLVPLAERMRPRTVDEIVGQQHILGPNTLLREAIETDQVPSLIFWGPPGSGKTTLARVIAAATRAELVALSAVDSGIKDIREAVAQAERRLSEHRRRTLLFIDEIHRFNKAQQDALLPHVERGTVTLIGATTENPSFEVNSALLSRCRVFALRALEESDLKVVLERALTDKDRGLKGAFAARPEFLEHVARHSSGDARRAISALEVAAARARGALSSFFAWCMRQGIGVKANPTIGTDNPVYGKEPRDRVLTDDEIRSVWRNCNDDDFGKIVRLLMLTAGRRDEIGNAPTRLPELIAGRFLSCSSVPFHGLIELRDEQGVANFTSSPALASAWHYQVGPICIEVRRARWRRSLPRR